MKPCSVQSSPVMMTAPHGRSDTKIQATKYGVQDSQKFAKNRRAARNLIVISQGSSCTPAYPSFISDWFAVKLGFLSSANNKLTARAILALILRFFFFPGVLDFFDVLQRLRLSHETSRGIYCCFKHFLAIVENFPCD